MALAIQQAQCTAPGYRKCIPRGEIPPKNMVVSSVILPRFKFFQLRDCKCNATVLPGYNDSCQTVIFQSCTIPCLINRRPVFFETSKYFNAWVFGNIVEAEDVCQY